MAKRLCKMNRKQIAENLGDIHRLVIEPKFVCRSCARSSSSQGSLCKPAAIPPQKCQDKPIEQQRACGLLAEALPTQDRADVVDAKKAQAVRRVIDKVKQKAATKATHKPSLTTESVVDISSSTSIKAAKKALKKQYKQQKKLLKLAKKQRKLLKKQHKLEAQVERQTPLIIPELVAAQTDAAVH
ncbi:hypothetical protein H4F20_17405 [Vibrio sp. 16]|uniref:hypothetical protein n=1 Tax=Vibrio sp. 16 TaxID=391586 RepID=UPI002FEF0493